MSHISKQHPKRKVMAEHSATERKISFLGSGSYVPLQKMESHMLDKRLKKPKGWVAKKSGVLTRYFAGDETATHMAAIAAQRALQQAGLSVQDLDCVVVASATMDQAMPYNAALLHRELGLSGSQIPAFDINTSCLSFLTALDMVSYLLAAGRFQRVLITSSDIASCGLNWNCMESSLIFGDGAAAFVVGNGKESPSSTILASRLETISEGQASCQIRAGGSRYHPLKVGSAIFEHSHFEMNGKRVYRLIAERMPTFISKLLKEAQLTMDDIALVIPHQASALALRHWRTRMGIRESRVMEIFPQYGNQVAASLPTTFHEARQQGRLKSGDYVLLVGTSAGVSMGGMILRYAHAG
jgi:3-oxoacyl-[acyl-carrier-protein] synthase-3